jgi:hypothetical protein
MICPLCLKKEADRLSLENHVKLHGYDDLQVEILLSYDSKFKNLIENANFPNYTSCIEDERAEVFIKFYKTLYAFLLPSEFEKNQLKIKKSYRELLALYKDILASKLWLLKEAINKGSNKEVSLDKFCLLALSDLYDDVKTLLNNMEEDSQSTNSAYPSAKFKDGTVYFSWDHIEFDNGKVIVHIYEINRHYSFKNEYSQTLLNIVKEFFFKERFRNMMFTIHFDERDVINHKSSTIHRLEEILKVEQLNISQSIRKLEIRRERVNLNSDYSNKVQLKPSDFKYEKNKFIKLAVQYCLPQDNIYSIKENNNGKEEHSLVIEFIRRNYVYVLVENENINRSAHLFTFKTNSENHIEKIYGFFFSNKENKRLLMRQAKEELKHELNTALKIRVLNHNNYQKYKENLQHYLYMLG